MRPVNLLPTDLGDERRRRLPSAARILAAAAPVVAAGLVGTAWSHAHAQANDRAEELAAARAQAEQLRAALGPAAPGAQLATLRNDRTRALDDALAKQVAWDGTLQAVARVLPSDVWLTQLTLQSPSPVAATTAAATSSSGASTAQGVQLLGAARSQAAVARALARLALVPGLSDVTLGGTTSATVDTHTVVQFQISATVGSGS